MDKSFKKRLSPIPVATEEIGKKVLDAAYAVHSALGPGLLESVYEACLTHKLRQQKVIVDTQIVMPVVFEGIQVDRSAIGLFDQLQRRPPRGRHQTHGELSPHDAQINKKP